MIGTTLGKRYEVVGELGRGGMGVVYRARDPLLGREVAVKLVSPGLLTEQAAERFQREAQMVAQMDHPAIVPIYDIGEHDGSMFFLMPVVRGQNLRAFLRAQARRLGDIIDIGIQAAEGLDYSHARGVIHRDVKPENIMVSEEEGGFRVRIMDFGLAKASTDGRLTRTGTLVGTVSYFSPEQVVSKDVDQRSDIYSLGTVLYEAIAGEPPFTGEMQAILYRIVHENPRPLRSLGADISQELEAVILTAIAKDPARRFQTAGELADALRRYRSTLKESDLGRSVVLSTVMTVQHRAAAAPFIGRESEIAELQRRLNAAVGGDCQFVLVAGEPGIGKTRLLEEIENLARARRIAVLHGRFMEQDRTFAYQGFCEAIQEYFRSGDRADSRDFSDLAADLVALFPVLSEISEIRPARSSDPALVGAEPRKGDDRTWVFELLARTMARMAGGKPLMLVFENLHSAELSLDALQYVVRRLGPTPTLIVGTYRQTEIDKRHPLGKLLDGFAADPRFHSMTLGPLNPSEHRSLIETMIGSKELGDGLAERLYEATEANPFFTKELVRSLLDSGGIARAASGIWTLSGEMAISSDALPATIQQTVEKRIQRLPEEMREVLSVAAVAGRSFEFRDLESLIETGGDLDEIVDRLVYEGLIEEERESRGDRLAFSSGIVRDVLYTAISRRKRKSLHRKFGELLEKRHSGRLERVYPQLVHHFSEGDVPEKTVEYGMTVARRSLDAFSPEEAVQTLRTVLEFLEDDDWDPPPGIEGEARMLLATALRQQGQIEDALREAEQAGRIFGRENLPGRAVAAHFLGAEIAFHGRRVEETRRWLELGIAEARKAGEMDVLVNLLSLAATVANLRGEYTRAKEHLDEIERLRPAELAVPAEDAIPSGGRLTVALGNPAPAREPAAIALVEESEILSLIFERLVATDERGHLVSLLCESWDMRDEGRAMHLVLRDGVRFHDGVPFDATAVKAYIERAVKSGRRDTAAWSAIAGSDAFSDGTATELEGIVVLSAREMEIRLRDPLPIYPALLTDTGTGIARVIATAEGERFVGTGPYREVAHDPERIVFEKNSDYWRAGEPRLDAIEFRVFRNAAAIASALRSGEIDLGHDLLPQDLDELLRDPRFRAGLQEAAKKITYFLVFNHASPLGGNESLRRALCGVVPVHDLVWRSLGRLAQPASTLIPPGILGHDAGRRRHTLAREQAREMLAQSGLTLPLRLRAAVHPLYRDRYRALTDALFEVWAQIGVQVEVATPTLESFMASYLEDDGVDLRIMRWAADYDDADNFVHGLFHSGGGVVSRYLASPEIDRIAEEGRGERSPAVREAIYRRFESLIAEEGSVLPLFHEIDYRLASPFVRGLALRSTPPFVNYAELGKTAAVSGQAAVAVTGGTIAVPVGGVVESLEPTAAETVESGEVLPAIFDSLTRLGPGARVVPGLASSIVAEDGGKRYRLRLREDVRFHDGRRFTARDVRYTFERLLTRKERTGAWLFTSVRGAGAVMNGSARELSGLQIVSPFEIVFELERPLSFFPTLLSHVAASILPEGTPEIQAPWTHCIGTGPFRLVEFEPERRLQLERNPLYWREGYPKSDSLIFHFGMPAEKIRQEFQAGRLSIANDLRPADVEALRHDPSFAAGYREMPRLSVYFAAFNRHSGPLRDPELRRRILREVDVASVVQRHLGRLAIPAHGIIPPGLIGYTPASSPQFAPPAPSSKRETIELTASVHPIFFEQYAGVGKELFEAFAQRGIHIKVASKTMPEYMETRVARTADLLIGRWFGDYPDADTFVYGMLHSQGGNIGRYCGSPELDHLIESGRVEGDPAIRHSIYHEVEQSLVREALLLPLFHEQIYRIARPEVDGLALSLGFPEVAYAELRMQR